MSTEMTAEVINKIIYFDKETIQNILQEWNKGESSSKTDISSSLQGQGSISIEASAKVKTDIPFLVRLSLLFSGKIEGRYLYKKDNVTTISSTEISEFEKLKPLLTLFEDVKLQDIENSSTALRVAGGYIKMLKDGVEEVDVKEFNAVMDSYNGYDTYKIDDKNYVRFNNTAFVSNYKRNELLITEMTLFCISVGEFDEQCFDFIQEMNKMETLFSMDEHPKRLSDIYPENNQNDLMNNQIEDDEGNNKVELYDVLYACVTTEVQNGK